MQHAVVALAGAHEIEISVRQELCCREREGREQLLGGVARKSLLEPHGARAILNEHRLLSTMGEKCIQRCEVETPVCSTLFHELTHHLTQLARGFEQVFPGRGRFENARFHEPMRDVRVGLQHVDQRAVDLQHGVQQIEGRMACFSSQ